MRGWGVFRLLIPACGVIALMGCAKPGAPQEGAAQAGNSASAPSEDIAPVRPEIYASVELTSDISHLSAKQREMLGILMEASEIMDGLFWQQAYGDADALLASLDSAETLEFAKINYGPWDRLKANAPFVPGAGAKPRGANFYPPDMSVQEFEDWQEPEKRGQYSLVRRDENGSLDLLPYSKAYAGELGRAAALLREAAELAEDPGFASYLRLRARAFETDDYQPSDLAWMDMKNNAIDVVIGPIENYEDQLFGYRAAFESYVLIKDLAWSERLSRYADFLPELQKGLPVPDEYKAESPGTDSDLNAYDAVYYAGDCNAGSKTIAINLP
ncbi:MAG: Zn-dependent hydrolase, partial [Gammaproteobacteria bacterium]|nr:Zn-dependent hydrolase [Gammaproteobacteria bacterium]